MASDAPAASAAEPCKVFVGNLSFKTREADLAHEFEGAGTVISANIITRGPRSLGYGFVEMENEDAAKKAVELMNKKEIDGREINVEIAKPRADGGERPPRPAGGRGRGRGRRGRGRGGRRPRGDGEDRQRTGTPSTTTLFVANLPFDVDDKSLMAIFDGLNAVSAHVVRKRNARSKGFGFVDFKNTEDQQKALEAKKGHMVEERELIIKVALKESEEAAAAAAEGAPSGDAKAEEPAAAAPAEASK